MVQRRKKRINDTFESHVSRKPAKPAMRSPESRLAEFLELSEEELFSSPDTALSGIEDVDFLRRFRDDETLPGSVRLSAQKELTRVLERKDAAAREAEQEKEWTPPGDPSLVAQALVDVLRVQSAETLSAFQSLTVETVALPQTKPQRETAKPARKSKGIQTKPVEPDSSKSSGSP